MSDPFYVARAEVTRQGSLHRRAQFALGATADMGVHGPIKNHYQLAPARDLPLPVDFIAAATGG